MHVATLTYVDILYHEALSTVRETDVLTDDQRVETHYEITIDPDYDDLDTINLRLMFPDEVIAQFKTQEGKVRRAMVEQTIVAYAFSDDDSVEMTITESDKSKPPMRVYPFPDRSEIKEQDTGVDAAPEPKHTRYGCAAPDIPFSQKLLTHQIHQTIDKTDAIEEVKTPVIETPTEKKPSRPTLSLTQGRSSPKTTEGEKATRSGGMAISSRGGRTRGRKQTALPESPREIPSISSQLFTVSLTIQGE